MASNEMRLSDLCINWANSVLPNVDDEYHVKTFAELKEPTLLARLIDTLWPKASLTLQFESLQESQESDTTPESTYAQLHIILDYLLSIGIKHSLKVEELVESDSDESYLDLIWLIILHFSIHTPKLHAFQRNVKVGKRMVLNWCREILPNITVNHCETLVENVTRENIVTELVNSFSTVIYDPDPVIHMTNVLEAGESEFGASHLLLNPEGVVDGSVDEEALLVYLALIRRKILQRTPPRFAMPLRAIRTMPTARLAWYNGGMSAEQSKSSTI